MWGLGGLGGLNGEAAHEKSRRDEAAFGFRGCPGRYCTFS